MSDEDDDSDDSQSNGDKSTEENPLKKKPLL